MTQEAGRSLEAHFIERGALSREAAARARASGTETGEPFSRAVVNLGFLSSRDVASGLSRLAGVEQIEPADFPESPVALEGLNPLYLKRNKVLPLELNENTLRVALADPTDESIIRALEFAFESEMRVYVAPLAELEEAIERLYFPDEGAGANANGSAGSVTAAPDDAARLKELAADAPVIKYVNRTVARALEAGASDIHFEPLERGFRVRWRIDGILREVDRPDPALAAAITSRVKIMSNLDIAERRLPQDGRFRSAIEGKEVDFRVSTAPTAHGESVVLRILERDKLPGEFESLGFDGKAVAPLRQALAKPDGIVLVTGPTGSGKTTTLYSGLRDLNSTDRKILTVEDPIEYMLEGVNQVQVDTKIGRTFAGTLRSFLRQDPDIIMVGEIRDRETAEIAVQASLTGHLVLSTLHTNSAAGALTRLLDMGIEDYLIASTVSVIAGQRLVRTLCRNCREAFEPDDTLRRRAGFEDGDDAVLYRARGCDACGQSGFAGRTGIIEVLEVSEAIRALITSHAEITAIERAARKDGMVPLFEDGLSKVREGITSFDEVLRVTREV